MKHIYLLLLMVWMPLSLFASNEPPPPSGPPPGTTPLPFSFILVFAAIGYGVYRKYNQPKK